MQRQIHWGSVRRGAAGFALAASLLLTVACGGGDDTGVAPPSVAPEVPFSVSVPENPSPTPSLQIDQGDVQAMAAAPGVYSLLLGSEDPAAIYTVDARTGRKLWSAPTGNSTFLASDTRGPAGAVGTGLVIAADDVDVPQEGLTPASVRTDIVAREAADGRERWRVEVLRHPADDDEPEELLSLVVQDDTTALITPSSLRVLETATGRERWRSDLRLTPREEGDSLVEGWRSVAIGAEDIGATARVPGQKAELVVFNRTTGKARWRLSAPSSDDILPVATFGRVEMAAGRVLVNYFTDGEYGATQSLRGYNLLDKKLLWRTTDLDVDDDLPFELDRADGTVVRTLEEGVTAINIQNGQVRWRQPTGVVTERVRAADGMTYLIGSSGDDTQVIGLQTRTGKQNVVLPSDRPDDVYLFAGAVAVIEEGVSIYR